MAAATPGRTGGRVVNDLTSFLLARIAEDEQNWRRLARDDEFREVVLLGCVIQADRILAECEAKRRIVKMHTKTDISWLNADGKLAGPGEDGVVYCELCSFHEQYEGFNDYEEPWPCPTLRLLALPYADHPDFQPEWRV
jgi:hypothetical protein